MDLVLSNDFSQLSAMDEMLVEGGVDWDAVGLTVASGAGAYIGAQVGVAVGTTIAGPVGTIAGAAVGAVIYTLLD